MSAPAGKLGLLVLILSIIGYSLMIYYYVTVLKKKKDETVNNSEVMYSSESTIANQTTASVAP